MEYINKPINPAGQELNDEDLIKALRIYIERKKAYEKQCEELSYAFGIAAMQFEKTKDSRYADRMTEINEIKDRAEKGLFPENAQTNIFNSMAKLTKSAIVNFRVDQEIKDKFSEMCEKNNMTIAEALRNAMLRAIDEQESDDRHAAITKFYEEKRNSLNKNLSAEDVKKLKELGVRDL